MKSIFRSMTAIGLILCFAAPSAKAIELPTKYSFRNAGFSDIPQDWSLPYITTCYELGLMTGSGNGLFAPEGQVSLAEGITVAARVHSLWRGGDESFSTGDPWYEGAVNYALKNGIMTNGQFSNYSLPATRAQLAVLLAHVLPEEDYTPLNSIDSLPDVTGLTPYASSIFKLYNAGILTGSDSYGTFSPDAPITRAELAAILCRLVRPDTRCSLSFNLFADPASLPSSSPIYLDASSLDLYLSSNSLAMITFYATWCPSCQEFLPTLDLLASKYQGNGIVIGIIDIDQESELVNQYDVHSYPTTLFFQDGQEISRQTTPITLEACEEILLSRL